MESTDALYELAIRSDNLTLSMLLHTPSWKHITQFAKTNIFWFQRTEWLVGRVIGWDDWNDADWKRVYYDFQLLNVKSDLRRQIRVFSVDFLENPASVRLALELGYRPDDSNLIIASSYGYTGTVAQLLALTYIDPTAISSAPLRLAAARGRTDVVQLLLDDRRSDPTGLESECLISASSEGYVDVVALLLKDGRADPADDDSFVLQCAVEGGHADVVALLLEDGRADPLKEDGWLVRIPRGKTREVLLADPRVRAAGFA